MLNSLISSNSILVDFLKFLYIRLGWGNFTTSFQPEWFFSFSFITVLPGPSSTMLTRNDENGHTCLIFVLRGESI